MILGFTKRYGAKLLVYYEFHDDMATTIRREKQLKEWRRAWKVRLIETMNPEWVNLFDAKSGEIADGPATPRGKLDSNHMRKLAWIPACAGMTVVGDVRGRRA